MGNLLMAIPALVVPVAMYALAAVFASPETLEAQAFTLQMPAGVWALSWGDVIVLVGLVCLFIDLLKSTSAGSATVVNHALSMAVFVACFVLFLLVPAFVSSSFFIIMMMTLLDVIAGFSIATISARRDVAMQQMQ